MGRYEAEPGDGGWTLTDFETGEVTTFPGFAECALELSRLEGLHSVT